MFGRCFPDVFWIAIQLAENIKFTLQAKAQSGPDQPMLNFPPNRGGSGGVRQMPRQSTVVRFGAYEVRLLSQELFKHGSRIKLPPQSFRVLQTLLDRPGELVTREEFHRALWPSDTFVDFDQGLNRAIKKIRDALCDSVETPRYIETLPKLGYRFIGQMNGAHEPHISTAEAAPANGNNSSI